jgi:hypothetical protein
MTRLECLCKKSIIYDNNDPSPVTSIYHPAHGWQWVDMFGERKLLCPDCLKDFLEVKNGEDYREIEQIFSILKEYFPKIIEASLDCKPAYIYAIGQAYYNNQHTYFYSDLHQAPPYGVKLQGYRFSLDSLYPHIRDMAEKEKAPSPGQAL